MRPEHEAPRGLRLQLLLEELARLEGVLPPDRERLDARHDRPAHAALVVEEVGVVEALAAGVDHHGQVAAPIAAQGKHGLAPHGLDDPPHLGVNAAGTALARRKLSPEFVAATLESQGGNVSATSRLLGIARSTVRAAVRGNIPVCPACNDRLGVCDGYCPACNDEISAEIDGRRGGDEWMPR